MNYPLPKPTLLPNSPEGTIVNEAYLRPATSCDAAGIFLAQSRAVVLLTDVSGMTLKNVLLCADTLSLCIGCDVWVPSLHTAGALRITLEAPVPSRACTTLGLVPLANQLRSVPAVLSRMCQSRVTDRLLADPHTIAFVKELKQQRRYASIGALGLARAGAAMAIRLASRGLFDTVAVVDPGNSGYTLGDVKAVQIPNFWLYDNATKDALDRAESALATRRTKTEVIEYEFHSYGVQSKPRFLRALSGTVKVDKGDLEQIVGWFNKTL
ncbi:hypothetical protein BDW22DRAFT_1354384 [Trametopsis cervina]|nr:hypothetical protein BDW22DRAFT_1354384 [Trametopsis cervina]